MNKPIRPEEEEMRVQEVHPPRDGGALQFATTWYILDVMRKGGKTAKRNVWMALLIDRDPDVFRAGLDRYVGVQERWLELGRHRNRDDAWDCAEQMLATRH